MKIAIIAILFVAAFSQVIRERVAGTPVVATTGAVVERVAPRVAAPVVERVAPRVSAPVVERVAASPVVETFGTPYVTGGAVLAEPYGAYPYGGVYAGAYPYAGAYGAYPYGAYGAYGAYPYGYANEIIVP